MRLNPSAVFFVLFTAAFGATLGYAFDTITFGALVGASVGLGIVCLATLLDS